MRERKDIKVRVDMYSDTKSKIIDTKPERDLIHYVWMALVLLAGKVNLEGDLYMSKNIPYTIETLAIEFNRGEDQIKLALDVLMELEMIEITENNVYRVKNFAKHQNIKVKKENKTNDKAENIKNNEVEVKENSIEGAADNGGEIFIEGVVNEDEVTENKTIKYNKENIIGDIKIIHKNINKNDDNMSDNIVGYGKQNNPQDNMPILLETKKNKKSNKSKKKEENIETIDEDIGDGISDRSHNSTQDVEADIICFHDGDEGRPLGEGERVLKAWSF